MMETTMTTETTAPEAPTGNIEVAERGGSEISATPEVEPQVEPTTEVEPTAEPETEQTSNDGDEDLIQIYEDEEGNEYYMDENGEYVPFEEEEEAEGETEGETEVDPQVAELEQQLIEAHMQSIFGSQEAYQESIAWAQENMSEQEQAIYDEVVEQGSAAQVAFAMKALHAMAGAQTQAEPQAPKMQDGTPIQHSQLANTGLQPFASQDAYRAAMRDPRYFDETSVGNAYRDEVDSRLLMSRF